MEKIRIANRTISEDSPCFIIAEAGVNHNGKLGLAKKLVDTAKSAGADAVKFQIFKAESLVTKEAPQAAYQRKSARARSQFEMLKQLELSYDAFKSLFAYCKKKKILFLATPFERESAAFLNKLKVAAFKISSADLTNIPFLRQVALYRKPIILSTGMATLREIRESVRAIYKSGNKQLILLQCTTDYPARTEDVNLKTMDALSKEFGVAVGYSDHTLDITIAIAAVARGARVIEKHLTLSKRMKGPDHKASLEPDEFRMMVKGIRNTEKALGDSFKKPVVSEYRNMKAVRKSIVAAADIKPNTPLTAKMLTVKRPGNGIAPKYIGSLKAKRALTLIRKDEVITWSKVA